MALINCPECNKEVSDKAEACPHCGYPIRKLHISTTPSPKPLIENSTNYKPHKVVVKQSIKSRIANNSNKTTTDAKGHNKLLLFVILMFLFLIGFVIVMNKPNKQLPQSKFEFDKNHNDSVYADSDIVETSAGLYDTGDPELDAILERIDRDMQKPADEDTYDNDDSELYTVSNYSTGESPFGSGIYDKSSYCQFKIENFSSNDAVVILVNKDGKWIRNVYVKKGITYTMKNVPQGSYIIKEMLGDDWNDEKDNGADIPRGGFMKNLSYSKSSWNNPFVFTQTETDDGIEYSILSITIHKVQNGNFRTNPIDKKEFFR